LIQLRRDLSALFMGAMLLSIMPMGLPAQPVDDPFTAPPVQSGAAAVQDPFAMPTPTPVVPFTEPGREDAPFDPFADTTSAAPFIAPPVDAATPTPVPRLAREGRLVVLPADIEARGLFVTLSGPSLQSANGLTQLVTDFRQGAFNRIYGEVRVPEGMGYDSAIETPMNFITTIHSNPLADLRERIEQRGQIFAVVDVLPVFTATLGLRPTDNSPAGRYPEYLTQSVDGRLIADDDRMYFDPGHPEARKYLAAVVFEIAQRVQPDGIVLRGLTYPGANWGYNSTAVAEFRRAVGGTGNPPPGDATWSAWRRAQITSLLGELTAAAQAGNPGVLVAVNIVIDRNQPPLTTLGSYLESVYYKERFQDWLAWTQQRTIDELLVDFHLRHEPQDPRLRRWVEFLNSNSGDPKPNDGVEEGVRRVISLSGALNDTQALRAQANIVRGFGVGTVLWHHANPTRDYSAGFYAGLTRTIYQTPFGRPSFQRPVGLVQQQMVFVPMAVPPPTYVSKVAERPTPVSADAILSGANLVFATPTPIPSPTPMPRVVPEAILRTVKLRSGRTLKAVVLEARPDSITLQEERGQPIAVPRNAVASIEPPI
jgi:uncharacterized lipoprotein YddW (UPF0748 family)